MHWVMKSWVDYSRVGRPQRTPPPPPPPRQRQPQTRAKKVMPPEPPPRKKMLLPRALRRRAEQVKIQPGGGVGGRCVRGKGWALGRGAAFCQGPHLWGGCGLPNALRTLSSTGSPQEQKNHIPQHTVRVDSWLEYRKRGKIMLNERTVAKEELLLALKIMNLKLQVEVDSEPSSFF